MVDHSLLLLTPDEMGEADRLAALSTSSYGLMQNAGRAVARAAARSFAPCRTLVLCGPGNNGGDGFVAARLLAQRGWPVTVARLSPAAEGTDASRAAASWAASTVGGAIPSFDPAAAARAELVIDAVFGAGLSRPVEGVAAAALAAARRVLAIDVPSGVDGATGAIRGAAARAELTVSFFRAKPGHLLLPGRDRLGTLQIAEIGIPEALLGRIGARTWRNRPGLWRLRPLSAADHKYTRGVVSVCGAAAMSGAARLAAAGARGAGAGLVRIAAEHAAALYRVGAPGLIVDEAPLRTLLADARRQVWVCGPGLAEDEVRAALPALLEAGRTVVADAGALSEAAGQPERLRGVAVVTPHEGEFARLFGDPGSDRLGAARAAAARLGAVVVLKGSDTVIAAPDGRAAINADAPPWLATAGAGDVLSGIVAAMLARGVLGGDGPSGDGSIGDGLGGGVFEAACAAVWLHGEAANLAGEGLLAEDLAGRVPAAMRRAAGAG